MCNNLCLAARNSLILKRRDVRVVEGARLENTSGDAQRVISNDLLWQSLEQLPSTGCSSVCRGKWQHFSSVQADLTQFLHNSQRHLPAYLSMCVETCVETSFRGNGHPGQGPPRGLTRQPATKRRLHCRRRQGAALLLLQYSRHSPSSRLADAPPPVRRRRFSRGC